MKRSKLSMRDIMWMGSLKIMRMWSLRRDLGGFGVHLRMLMVEGAESMVWCRSLLLQVPVPLGEGCSLLRLLLLGLSLLFLPLRPRLLQLHSALSQHPRRPPHRPQRRTARHSRYDLIERRGISYSKCRGRYWLLRRWERGI